MTTIEKIRAEIERLKSEAWDSILSDEPKYLTHYKIGRKEVCADILAFLDTLQEQPVEGLEDEIDACWQNWLSPSNQKEVEGVLPKTEFATYARHFYDLGCRHTAVMYDDIEHERQRAEEAEISGDLEEEIERQLDVFPYTKVTPELPESRLILIRKQLRPFARHFAEWGAEHLKK